MIQFENRKWTKNSSTNYRMQGIISLLYSLYVLKNARRAQYIVQDRNWLLVNTVAGAFCGITVDSISYPLDTIKTFE